MLTGLRKWSIMLLLFSFGATTVMAGDCSVASIKGSFSFVEQGTALAPPVMLPYASSGIGTFDGAGHLSGKVTANIGGMLHKDTFTGTYTVDADCTFSIEFKGSLGDVHHQEGTLTGEGMFQEGHYIYTDTNLVASGTAKRLSSGK